MLNPGDGETIIDVQRDGYVVQATISEDTLQVDTWDWTLTAVTAGIPDSPPCFEITPQGNDLLVEYVSDEGIFPLEQLRYLDQDYQPVDITDWNALPEEAPHIVLMRPAAPGTWEWELAVSATDDDGGEFGDPVTNSATYTLLVTNDLNVDRDRLVQEVNARS